jgi:hypothetical protein
MARAQKKAAVKSSGKKAAKKATSLPLAQKKSTKAQSAANATAANLLFRTLQQTQSVTVPLNLADMVEAEAKAAKLAVNRIDGEDTARFVREIKKRDGRMARSATINKFQVAIEAAIAAGRVSKEGVVELTQEDIMGATLAETWMKTQHGWKDNMTCGRSAIANGYPNYKLVTNKDPKQRRVLLAPEGVSFPE